jgi:hypothetical protein
MSSGQHKEATKTTKARRRLQVATKRLYLARLVTNHNTPESTLDRLIEAAKPKE